MANPKVWVVHAPVEIADKVEADCMVAIGWFQMGDLSNFDTREKMKSSYHSVYPDDSEPKIWVGAGQLYRFAHVIQIGDYVLTPLKASREVLIGEVTGDYEFKPEVISKEYPNIRRVKWLQKVSRDNLSQPFKYALGGIMTVFQVNAYLPEVKALLQKKPVSKDVVEEAEIQQPATLFYEDVRGKADEMISDLLSQIDAYDFQELVAGVLRAMGFKTRVSSPGRDLGVDIVAHPDAFGFESPRIKMQVKHRKGQATAPEVRALAGTVRENENGLFVSTSGFTTDALREPERGAKITLIDRDQFVNLLLENYEKLEPQYQAIVPLRKVYIPISPSYVPPR